MTQNKRNRKGQFVTTKISFTIEGIDEYQDALNEVIDAFAAFKESANDLQQATNNLNAIEIKVNAES